MKQHVILLHILTGATVSYSHGLASLAAVLREAKDGRFDVVLITVRDENISDAADRIVTLEPAIVFVSVMSNQWERAKLLASAIKQREPTIPCCVGGTHAAAAPASIYSSHFDAGFPGEAEDAIKTIVLGGDLNLTSVIERVRISSEQNSVVQDLDHLPLPHLEIFDKQDILEYPSVMFSRGCAFKCSYCMSRQGGIGGKIRWKSPMRAIQEVHNLVAYADPEEIYLDDDTLLKNPAWVREFCGLYRNSVGVPFYCNARPETVSLELAHCLREAQCSAIGIGIESGSARVRRDVLQRPMEDEAILRAFDAAHKAGLKTWSFNMVGLPGERTEDLLSTIRLNEAVQTEFVRVSIFTPYPGTPIYDPTKDSLNPSSYFRGAQDLPDELQPIYRDWINRLDQEGRLWFTKSESDEQKQHASESSEVNPGSTETR